MSSATFSSHHLYKTPFSEAPSMPPSTTPLQSTWMPSTVTSPQNSLSSLESSPPLLPGEPRSSPGRFTLHGVLCAWDKISVHGLGELCLWIAVCLKRQGMLLHLLVCEDFGQLSNWIPYYPR